MNLVDLWNDRPERIFRTARHEAGHAVVAWLVSGGGKPPFKYVEIQPEDKMAGGIVPGGVEPNDGWFETLTPVDKVAIYLAGAYFQDREAPFTEDDWQRVVESKDGGDSVNDVALAMNVAELVGLPFASLIQDARQRIESFGDDAEKWVYTIAVVLMETNRIDAANFSSIMAKGPRQPPATDQLECSVSKLALVLKDGTGAIRALGLGSSIASALDELGDLTDTIGEASLQSFIELLEDVDLHDAQSLKDATSRVKEWHDIADGQATVDAVLMTISSTSTIAASPGLQGKVADDLRALSTSFREFANDGWLFCLAYSQ